MEFEFKEQHVETTFEFGDLVISGDETQGFRPFQLMVSSIVSCSGAVFKQILVKKRIDFTELTASAEVTRNEKKANRIERIDITFYIKGADLDLAKLEKSLAIASKNCAMVQSVKESIEVNESIQLIS